MILDLLCSLCQPWFSAKHFTAASYRNPGNIWRPWTAASLSEAITRASAVIFSDLGQLDWYSGTPCLPHPATARFFDTRVVVLLSPVARARQAGCRDRFPAQHLQGETQGAWRRRQIQPNPDKKKVSIMLRRSAMTSHSDDATLGTGGRHDRFGGRAHSRFRMKNPSLVAAWHS
ncbi:hypothetical protein CGRA01v4_06360 [Colletotrichum graminicola]|nr:hypothetical protein CGRA01v4_06360 [Colletotrichum graminicola]